MEACPTCGEQFKNTMQHIRQSDCPYPWPTPRQQEILEGMLLGDGSIGSSNGGKGYMNITQINRQFLVWLDNELGWVSSSISLQQTAKQSKDNLRDFTGEKYNTSDVYQLTTVRHPYFTKLEEWYKTGEKVFPENTKLTPMRLKMWYCSDGNKQLRQGENARPSMVIACDNEYGNEEKLKKMFYREALPVPEIQHYRREDGKMSLQLRWGVDASEDLFDYMGEPPSGMEYKWPDN
jgi:hypothetical protein